jgi:aminoglycoside phosphotransferase (APT) family kinase protein
VVAAGSGPVEQRRTVERKTGSVAIRAVLSPEDLTPEVLGPILGTEVGAVEVRQTATTLAGAFALVSIDGSARFVKWTRSECRSELKAERNRRECRVLTDAGHRAGVPVPRCHAAIAFDDGSSTIVLDDLSAGWMPSGPDTPEWRERAVDALARLHSAFFDGDWLIANEQPSSSVDDIRDRLRSRVLDMSAADAVPSEQLAALRRIVDGDEWAISVERVAERDRVTLLHGDTHPGNFLYERAGDRAILVDWELVEVGIPTDDLAMFLGFHGPSDLESLLGRYRSAVGVDDDTFAADWRRSVLRLPLVVTAFWQNGIRGRRLRGALDQALARVDALA